MGSESPNSEKRTYGPFLSAGPQGARPGLAAGASGYQDRAFFGLSVASASVYPAAPQRGVDAGCRRHDLRDAVVRAGPT